MNWQKFIGVTIGILSILSVAIFSNFDWKIIIATIIYGIGGVIYGNAE